MRKYNKNVLDVVYVSDENFIGLTGISIYSLLKNNLEFEKINIYIIDNGIEKLSKEKVTKTVENFNRNIQYIPAIDLRTAFHMPDALEKNLTVYNNLFLCSLLDVDKVLYLDGDLIVISSLKELWEINIDKYYFAAVQDICGIIERHEANIAENELYFNSGVIMFNLELCRKDLIEEKFIDSIQNGPLYPIFRSQRVLNQVCKNRVLRISPKYNLLNEFIEFTLEDLKVFHQSDGFYEKKDLEEANEHPVIIHFAGVERPWCYRKCHHKYTELFLKISGETYWENIHFPPTKRKKLILDRFLHYHLPHSIYMKMKYIIRKYRNYRYFKKYA